VKLRVEEERVDLLRKMDELLCEERLEDLSLSPVGKDIDQWRRARIRTRCLIHLSRRDGGPLNSHPRRV